MRVRRLSCVTQTPPQQDGTTPRAGPAEDPGGSSKARENEAEGLAGPVIDLADDSSPLELVDHLKAR